VIIEVPEDVALELWAAALDRARVLQRNGRDPARLRQFAAEVLRVTRAERDGPERKRTLSAARGRNYRARQRRAAS
jgi:hypothetical protein